MSGTNGSMKLPNTGGPESRAEQVSKAAAAAQEAEQPKAEPKKKAGPAVAGAKILVTGATGFVGQYVVPLLEQAGAKVIAIGKRHGYDLSVEAQAMAAMLAAKPDVVVHLATPPENIGAAARYREATLINVNLVHATSMSGAKLVVVQKHGSPWSIEERIQIDMAYLCSTYRTQHHLDSVQLVPYEIYGPLDHFERGRLIPELVRGLAKAKASALGEIEIPNCGEERRSLLFASDAAQAIVAACVRKTDPVPISISGPVIEMKSLYEVACEVFNYDGKVEFVGFDEADTEEDFDDAVGRMQLEWSPSTSVKVGLTEILEWLQASSQKARELQEPV